MPSYIISNCLLGTPIDFIVTATTLSIGEIVCVNKDETNYCGMVMSENDYIPDSVLVAENFTSCCDCLIDAGYNSFVFTIYNNCTEVSSIRINITAFCEVYGSPPTFINTFWRLFDTETGESYCAEFKNISRFIGTSLIIPDDGPFENCDSCSTGTTTYTAGTEYTVCVICEDCCASGTTATTVNPPHPTWTRPDGNAVVLLDAVQLGGMFGLNN